MHFDIDRIINSLFNIKYYDNKIKIQPKRADPTWSRKT